MLNELRK